MQECCLFHNRHACGVCQRLNSCSTESNTVGELGALYSNLFYSVKFPFDTLLYSNAVGHRFSSHFTFTLDEGKMFHDARTKADAFLCFYSRAQT